MSERSVTVETGSRLHFGLLSFGNTEGRQFGGVGVMVDGGGIRLAFRSADKLEISGPLRDRVADLVSRYVESQSLSASPPCHIGVLGEPRHHVGLGTGTQLGLAVAAGLDAWLGKPWRKIESLAEVVGRGMRSAVGAYGFEQGGFIYEEGKLPSEDLSPLSARVALPESWRFVLFCDSQRQGLSGQRERESFAQLPAVPKEMTQRLQNEVTQRMLPAAEAADLDAFGESVYQYGCLAGECFATGQGGVYASEDAQCLVHAIRAAGVRGVGQSSWGPTIFALTKNDDDAQQLVDRIASTTSHSSSASTIVGVRNTGVAVHIDESSATSTNG